MPLVELPTAPRDIGTAGRVDVNPDIETDVSGLESFSAGFQRENMVSSFLQSQSKFATPFDVEDGFDVGGFVRDHGLEDHANRFDHVFNSHAANAVAADIRRETKLLRDAAANGTMGILGAMAGGVFDLPTLAPTGVLFGSVRAGAGALRVGAAVAGASGVDAAISETGLQATQQTRTATESALNIGGSILLGGILGAGVSRIVGPKAYMEAARKLDRELSDTSSDLGDQALEIIRQELDGGSVGAAAVERADPEEFSIAGKSAKAVAKMTGLLNPQLRTLRSPNTLVQQISAQLMETNVYTNRNLRGEGEAAVETAVRQWINGYAPKAIRRIRAEWKSLKGTPDAMPYQEFNERVAAASRRNDIDPGGIEAVSRAARALREDLFDRGLREAQELGLLPEDLAVKTAPTYFTRVWNRIRLVAQEGEFKAVTRQWLDEEISRVSDRAEQAFLSAADRRAYIDEITDQVFDKLTGRAPLGDGESNLRVLMAPKKRGPLNERTFLIPDERVEKFLESDIELVARQYAKTVGADIELTRKFGRADMRDQIAEVRQEYKRLRKEAKSEAERKRLDKLEKRDVRDLEGVRDVVRGSYLAEANSSDGARILRGLQTFNFATLLGAVSVASIPELARPIMVHGLRNFMSDAAVPLIKNLKAAKLSVREGQLAGLMAERVNNGRIAALADLADPYSANTPFERMLDNMASTFANATGITYLTDGLQAISSLTTQARILRNVGRFEKLGQRDLSYMGFVGIDKSMAARIARYFDEFGETVDGVAVANTEKWPKDAAGQAAVRAYRNAVSKDVTGQIVQPGAGDLPLRQRHPIGRAILSLKSFAIASNQRVLLRGMQEDATNFWTGLVLMSTLGMFTYWARAQAFNRELSDNPGTWIAEGLDRSGVFSIMFEANNLYEKLGGQGVYSALSAAGQAIDPSADAQQPASRFASRSALSGALGPTVGLVGDSLELVGSGLRGDLTPGDINTMRRLTPFAGLPYIRPFLEYGLIPDAQDAVR